MGLDMYLYRDTYLGWNHDFVRQGRGNPDDMRRYQNSKIDVPGVRTDRLSGVRELMGYWRKANHIHNWFVQNVQNGVDECQEARVTIEQLKELHLLCTEVLVNRNKGKELLPTQEGFFFGPTEYGEYYFEDLQKTVNILEKVFEEDAEHQGCFDYIYRSSW